jgi:hypothetical protein
MKPPMACLRIIAVLFAVLAGAFPALSAGAFLAECEDLPLPPGLTELPGGTLFDTPNGRIVEATAEGNLAAAAIRSFYTQALPQLGWERLGETSFRRDNEVLRIDIEDKKHPLSVHFSVAPQ